MAKLPNIVGEGAIGLIFIVAQRRTGARSTSAAKSPGKILQSRVGISSCGINVGGSRKREGTACGGICELRNLTVLELEAGATRMPADHVTYGIANAIDVLGITRRVASLTQSRETRDRNARTSIFRRRNTATAVREPCVRNP